MDRERVKVRAARHSSAREAVALSPPASYNAPDPPAAGHSRRGIDGTTP